MEYLIKKATPQWSDLPDCHSGYEYEKYMIEKHGFKIEYLPGHIGYSGEKIHEFKTLCKRDGNVLLVANYASYCGSSKFGSGLSLYNNGHQITCKKCNPKQGD